MYFAIVATEIENAMTKFSPLDRETAGQIGKGREIPEVIRGGTGERGPTVPRPASGAYTGTATMLIN